MTHSSNDSKIIAGTTTTAALPDSGSDFLGIPAATGSHAPVCAVCGTAIDRTSHFHLDRYNTAACAQHRVRYCAVCRRMLTDGGSHIAGLGHVCGKCSETRTYAELGTICRFVQKFYREKHIYVPAFRATLVPPDEMKARYFGTYGSTPLGVALEGPPHRVELTSTQSKVSMASTLAHEMLHLWQYHRGIMAPAPYSEGFCNLGAFLVTGRIARGEALVKLLSLMENPDHAYGHAFRELKVLYDVYGWRAVVAAMKRFAPA